MRKLVLYTTMLCFVVVAALSDMVTGHAGTNTADNGNGDAMLIVTDILQESAEPEACACESKPGNTVSISCGVVLGLEYTGYKIAPIAGTQNTFEWTNRIGLKLYPPRQKRPPRTLS